MMAEQPIIIGLLVPLFGPFAQMGVDGVRGVELALAEFGGKIGEKPIRPLTEGTNAIPDDALVAAQTLIDGQHVDFIIGPLTADNPNCP